MSRRPRERTRHFGAVTVTVRHADGAARGSTLRWGGQRFLLAAFPSRVRGVEPRDGALAVRTSDGRERLVFAETAQ